jgi:CheY-like chemotaxis protein
MLDVAVFDPEFCLNSRAVSNIITESAKFDLYAASEEFFGLIPIASPLSQIVYSGTGREGRTKVLHAKQYDAIVVQLNLAGEFYDLYSSKGYEGMWFGLPLIKEIRDSEVNCKTPILALHLDDDVKTLEESIKAGVDLYMNTMSRKVTILNQALGTMLTYDEEKKLADQKARYLNN